MKIKEEHDERQKRTELNIIPIMNGNVSITPTPQIKTEGELLHRSLTESLLNHFLPSAGASLKRTSPIVHHHRPSKIRHFDMNDSLLSSSSSLDVHQHSGRQSTTMELMSPEINSMTSEDRAHIRPKHDDG